MTDLRESLLELGREIEFPPTPDLLAGASLDRRGRRGLPRRRALVLALAALAAVTVAGLALSPGARSAFRELLGIGGVEIVRLDEAPPATAESMVPFGRPVTLAEATRSVPFRILLPARDVADPPARVYLDRAGGGIVSLVWCCERRIVLTELPSADPAVLQKTVGPSTLVEAVDVGDGRGLWVEGSDHVLRAATAGGGWSERPILVRGGVLIWTRGEVTLRLEGELTRAEAIAVAERIR